MIAHNNKPLSCRPAHLSINDICDVAGGQQRHPDKLQHVRQVRLALFSVVLDPVQHGLKHRLLRVHLRADSTGQRRCGHVEARKYTLKQLQLFVPNVEQCRLRKRAVNSSHEEDNT